MQISVQLALQADTEKITLDGSVDLKNILVNQTLYEKSGFVINFKNDIKLFYGIKAKINNQKTMERQDPSISPHKNMRDKSKDLNKRSYANI